MTWDLNLRTNTTADYNRTTEVLSLKLTSTGFTILENVVQHDHKCSSCEWQSKHDHKCSSYEWQSKHDHKCSSYGWQSKHDHKRSWTQKTVTLLKEVENELSLAFNRSMRTLPMSFLGHTLNKRGMGKTPQSLGKALGERWPFHP